MITYLPCNRHSGKTPFIVNLCRVTDRSLLMVANSRRMRDIVNDYDLPSSHIILPQARELRSIHSEVTIFVDELGDIPEDIQEMLQYVTVGPVFAVGGPEEDRLIGPVRDQMFDERHRRRAEPPSYIPPETIAGNRRARSTKKKAKKKAVKKKVAKKKTRYDALEME